MGRTRRLAKNVFLGSLRRRVENAGAALASSDGRWALVSTSMTALVAGSIAWMALGTLPVSGARLIGAATHTPLSYQLFLNLMRSGGDASVAALAPLVQAPVPTDDAEASSGVDTSTVTLDSGDTLAGVLENAGASASDANAAIAALPADFDARSLRPGQSLDLTFQATKPVASAPTAPAPQPPTTIVMVNQKPVVVPVDAAPRGAPQAAPMAAVAAPNLRLLALHFSPSVEEDVTVTRTPAGNFTAQTAHKTLVPHIHRAGAKIDSSLYLAAMQAGIPADVVVEMIHMFSYKVDFQRDLQPGDSFQVYYDYYYTPDGQPVKEGSISYAMMDLGGKQIALYRYQTDPDQPADYFDASGQSAKGMLMKTPVDGARISSGFGMRMHPVLGYTRMHKGIDFAVPVGTPVMAAGEGVVNFAGPASGYGNFLKIAMSNGWGTGYGHLSRFAPGIHVGSRVHQGEIIAYSGNTGLTTGPHLHYEIYEHGTQVNPLKVKVADGRKLAGRELEAFLDRRLKIDAAIAAQPLETKVADISSDLRQAKAR